MFQLLVGLLERIEQPFGWVGHTARLNSLSQRAKKCWLPLLMRSKRRSAAVDVVSDQPAAHHLRPVQAVLIERVAQLQEEMQSLCIEANSLLVRTMPKLAQRFPEGTFWQIFEQLRQMPAQLSWIPGVLQPCRQSPIEGKDQLAQVAACEVEFNSGADADALAEGQGQPAAHGIGADQYPLGFQRIIGLVAAEFISQG